MALGVRTLEHTQASHVITVPVGCRFTGGGPWGMRPRTHASHVITVPVGYRFTGGGPWGTRPRTHTSKSRYYCTRWLQIYRRWPLGYAPYNTSKSRYYCTRWLVDLQGVALGVRALEHTQASHVITVPVGCRFTGGGPWGTHPTTQASHVITVPVGW